MSPLVANESIDPRPSPTLEKTSRNKRKFKADTPDQSKSFLSALDDLPPYDFAGENSGAMYHGENVSCDMCGSCQDHSSGLSSNEFTDSSEMCPVEDTEEVESGNFKDADWNELTEAQLEELLLTNLDTIFTSAIKKIVAHGYSEEVATKSIMRTGISHGFKDAMSNIVENVITSLTASQHTNSSKESYFDDLQQLGRYILAEMVCVFRALKPSFSNGDAMWYLLICDMNVSQACTMDDATSTSNNSSNVGSPNEISSIPADNHLETANKISEMKIPDPCKSSDSTPSLPPDALGISALPNTTSPKQSSVLNKVKSEKKNFSNMNTVNKQSNISGSSQMLATEGMTNTSRKVHLSTSSKREFLHVQKALNLDKGSGAIGYKGGLKSGKTGRLAGACFNRKLKSMTQSSSIHHRMVSANTSKAVGIKVPHEHEKLKPTDDQPKIEEDFRQDSDNSKAPLILSSIITPPPSPKVNKPAFIPIPETELSLCLPGTRKNQEPVGGHVCAAGCNTDYYQLRKLYQQLIGSKERDSDINKLAPKVEELQSELEEWTDWANQKIMQAARRLGKDKAELKSLRQERQEVDKLKRDKKTMEEHTMKKLSEMENALRKASGQVDRANCSFRRLEMVNAALKQQMETARFQSAESVNGCQEASAREKKTLMELQSWEKQNKLFQEELVNEKRKSVQVQKELAKAKDMLFRVEAKLEKEIKVKEDLKVQASSIWKQIEQAEAMSTSKDEVTKLKAENSLHKYRDNIQKLESEISQLRLNKDSSKIAALRMGIDGGYVSRQTDFVYNSPVDKDSLTPKVTPENSSSLANVNRNRECVMCLSEEMSVMFLPCAHQVVCSKCNDLHEKKGMKECPSCRTPIGRRIVVRYAVC